MPDLICCENCGQVFELHLITSFVEHKVKGCYKRTCALDSKIECAYCSFTFMLPLDLITHVQSVHNVPVAKIAGTVIAGNNLGRARCCFETNELCSEVESNGTNVGSNDSLIVCNHLNASTTHNPNESGPIENGRADCGVQLQSTVSSVRKTCCLVDGGPPCEQITLCPIIASYGSGCNSVSMPTECNGTLSRSVGLPNNFDHDSPDSTQCVVQSTSQDTPSTNLSTTDRQLSPLNAPFTCEYCHCSFKQKVHLKKHLMSTHLRQKPFKCNTCGYATVERSHLTIHIRRHTGERPFACMLCNYRAAQHVTLKRHCLKKHRSMFFGCPTCGTQCITLTELENHKKLCVIMQKNLA